MRMLKAFGGALVVFAGLSAVALAQGVNVTGTWMFDVQTGGGAGQTAMTPSPR